MSGYLVFPFKKELCFLDTINNLPMNPMKKKMAKTDKKASVMKKRAVHQESKKRPPKEESSDEEDSVLSGQNNGSGMESADEEGEMVYSSGSGDEISGEDGNDSLEEDEQQDDKAKESGGDGFANVLNKILNQNVGNKNPVLAKRKTQIMKEQEAHSQEVREEKRRRLTNKQEREKQMVAPSYITLDYERQLKKVATRGVIALFNAIHKAKKDDGEAEEKDRHHSKSVATTSAASDIKALTQEKFLELLKHGTGGDSNENKKDQPSNKDKPTKQVAESSKGWGAVKDDFLLDKKIALKDWDKESDSEDGAADHVDDDHVEIDSDAEAQAEKAAHRSAGHHKHATGAKRSGGKARR